MSRHMYQKGLADAGPGEHWYQVTYTLSREYGNFKAFVIAENRLLAQHKTLVGLHRFYGFTEYDGDNVLLMTDVLQTAPEFISSKLSLLRVNGDLLTTV